MDVQLVGSTGDIRDRECALKYCQDFARVCYSEKNFSDVKGEPYNSELVEGRLIKTGHHSVFDHFNLSFSFEGLPKAMAMVFNNEPLMPPLRSLLDIPL
ncbi:MAG: FAD-dependent thymidylate synthase [archaeon]